MSRLSLLSEREFGLTLARPCSPTSKGSVEGLFHVPEDIFKGLPGWIGGRRDNKTSANKGKVVAPYSKRLDQLAADILACVGIYNSRAHSAGSRIAGLSPKEVYEIKAAATGFRPRHFSEEAFDLTFSKADSKIVRQSAVTIENRTFHGNYLHEVMTGEKMEVQVPLRKGMDHAWINGPGKQPQLIKAAPRFACGDRRGAVYQSGLEAMSNAAVKALGKNQGFGQEYRSEREHLRKSEACGGHVAAAGGWVRSLANPHNQQDRSAEGRCHGARHTRRIP